MLAFIGLFTATFLLPFLLETASGYAPLDAGLLLTPLPIAMAVVAPISGTLADRIGPRLPASLGMAIAALGLAGLTTLPDSFAPSDLLWRLLVIGIGMGMFTSPNSSAVLGSVPRSRIGTASGTLAQMRINGQALGIALSSAVVAIRLPIHLAQLADQVSHGSLEAEAFVLAIHDAFLIAAIACTLAVAVSLVRGAPAPAPAAARTAASD